MQSMLAKIVFSVVMNELCCNELEDDQTGETPFIFTFSMRQRKNGNE